MKKFFTGIVFLVFVFVVWDVIYYDGGLLIRTDTKKPVEAFSATQGRTILVDTGDGKQPFEIRGVDLGLGIPGHFATEYAIDKETYLRWFGWIQEMGANTIRVYTIQSTAFYDAFYEYNCGREEPLYLLHGVWVDDYVQNSHMDAYQKEYVDTFIADSKALVDVIHGRARRPLTDAKQITPLTYRRDISQWVLGYILGVEWEYTTVVYTDEMQKEKNSYQGAYMYTTEDATPFEAMLAQVGDAMIGYETEKYKQQRLLAFSNWPTTDPFTYPAEMTAENRKYGVVDVEHIGTTDAFLSGQFASYHVYPYFPDYLSWYDDWKTEPWADQYLLEDGTYNTYGAYLYMLVQHHEMPVVISEFGVPSSRGRAQPDSTGLRSQGYMSEVEQGEAIEACYQDIKNAGCAGSVIFTWQDEWFKRTWNTMANVDLQSTAYWSDDQTNEQNFGLLAFDPGEEKSVCYVDGDTSEWSQEDVILSDADGTSLSVKYDEKFLYLYIDMADFDLEKDVLYVPFDITPKTGSFYADGEDVKFDRQADFLLVIQGKEESRLLVQERYDVFPVVFAEYYGMPNPYTCAPDRDSPVFNRIYHALQLQKQEDAATFEAGKFETGKLTYGNANPDAEDFNSVADFMADGSGVEIRLPWQLLNFGDPSKMQIHDDYYENYGVEFMGIDEIYIGVGADADKQKRIKMAKAELKGWGYEPTYHERLKKSYYMVKKMWASQASGGN